MISRHSFTHHVEGLDHASRKRPPANPRRELELLSKATAFLVECVDLDEVKSIRDKAEAMRLYMKQRGDSIQSQNAAAKLKLRAERRLGELQATGPKQHGARGVGKKVESHDVTPLPTLADKGITKMESSRWQAVAAVRLYMKQRGDSIQSQNAAAKLKLRAERRLGELQATGPKQRPGEYQRSHDVTVAPSLSDKGITKMESSRWQAVAAVPEEIEREMPRAWP